VLADERQRARALAGDREPQGLDVLALPPVEEAVTSRACATAACARAPRPWSWRLRARPIWASAKPGSAATARSKDSSAAAWAARNRSTPSTYARVAAAEDVESESP